MTQIPGHKKCMTSIFYFLNSSKQEMEGLHLAKGKEGRPADSIKKLIAKES